MKMQDFTKRLSEKLNVTQAKASETFKNVLDCLFESIEEEGEEGSIRTEYGTFKMVMTSPRAAREGVNPRDPEGPKLQIPAIPAKKKIAFKMSKKYDEDLNS